MTAYFVITTLILIVCVLLILIVLVQNSKGGGLAANFSSQNQTMGVRKTTDFLEKATWTLAISLVFLSLVSIFFKPVYHGSTTEESKFKQMVDEKAMPVGEYQAPPEDGAGEQAPMPD
ncbi:MAG: preprotein translocase subunit SecG [Bacteroidetes bacterium]|nr:preprotein translocase subunit SecG [Bacteroidota bacterium]MBU1717689.1 preprotein translocase subunit SecG [Bacteroidota bacterium]